MNEPTYFGFLVQDDEGNITLNEDESTWNYDNDEEYEEEEEE